MGHAFRVLTLVPRTQLGMVFQSFNLWQHMTVLQNVIEVPVHVLGMPKEPRTDADMPFSEIKKGG